MDNCSYFDCTLVIRVGFVIYYGWVYPHFARHRGDCYYFASHQRAESNLKVANAKPVYRNKGGFMRKYVYLLLVLLAVSLLQGCSILSPSVG